MDAADAAFQYFPFGSSFHDLIFLFDLRHVVFLEDLFGKVQVVHGPLAVGIIQYHRLAYAGRFAQTGIAVDDTVEYHVFKMAPYLAYHLVA